MRAIGPGSVSSLLKIALDVVYVALWILIGILLVLAVAFLVIPITTEIFRFEFRGVQTEIPVARAKLIGSGACAWFAVYSGIVLFVVAGLRRVFATLTIGDPFHPDNISRLRIIGLGLAGLQFANEVAPMVFNALLPVIAERQGLPNLPAWLAVMVVFVLAEVFREGARLRREAELTI